MEMSNTIIARDINMYTASLEQAQDSLIQCYPNEEPHWELLIAKNRAVLDALKDLDKALDSVKDFINIYQGEV
jgi:hypothetical protein